MPQDVLIYTALLLYSGIISLILINKVLNVTSDREKLNLQFFCFRFYFHEVLKMGKLIMVLFLRIKR